MERYSPAMQEHVATILHALTDAELLLHYQCLLNRKEATTGLSLVETELTMRGLRPDEAV